MVLSVAEAPAALSDDEAAFDAELARLASSVKLLHPSVAIGRAQRVLRTFEAVELAKIAEHRAAGASEREARDSAGAGGTRSKKAACKAAKRADAVLANPHLAVEVEAGLLGAEQLDAIAFAADKTGGEAATDSALISEIREASPDEAYKISGRWLERRDDENGVQTRYERQRKQRNLRFGFDARTGCESMHMEGDRESIKEIRRAVQTRADALYRSDGGRDLPPCKHPRTHDQRMFDALCDLLVGSNNDATNKGPGHGVRTMLHVSVTVDDEAADQIRAATIGGSGLLPKSVLERYACGSTIAATVFTQRGQVLWHGRQKRHATDAQLAALIARDQGCVMCGAEPSRCEAHHTMPWNAPGKGKTNIDEMALLCADDHHKIHEQQLTLYRQLGPPGKPGKSVWKTRPAEPHELPMQWQ